MLSTRAHCSAGGQELRFNRPKGLLAVSPFQQSSIVCWSQPDQILLELQICGNVQTASDMCRTSLLGGSFMSLCLRHFAVSREATCRLSSAEMQARAILLQVVISAGDHSRASAFPTLKAPAARLQLPKPKGDSARLLLVCLCCIYIQQKVVALLIADGDDDVGDQ